MAFAMRAARRFGCSMATAPFWLVADMDKTLIDKPPPAVRPSPSFSQSPAFAPTIKLLQSGGRLCVVTTDDGFRPFQHLWQEIPAELRSDRRVVMATSDGAAMFYGDKDGQLVEDSAYAAQAEANCSLRLPTDPQQLERLLMACKHLYVRFIIDLKASQTGDGKLLSCLDKRARSAYEEVLAKVDEGKTLEAGKNLQAQLEELLSIPVLTRPGGVMSRGTMLWMNQAGPMDQWIRAGGKDDAFFGFYAQEGQPQPAYTNLFMMGLPQAVSKPYISDPNFVASLKVLGLEASAAPNSVCIRSAAVSKDLPVRWLAGHPEYQLDFATTVAFGDNPFGNDRPLAELPVLFVSVAPESPGLVPKSFEEGGFFHVGGCEAGTAHVLEMLHAALQSSEHNVAAVFSRIPEFCSHAASHIKSPQASL